jgi:hypothetical protein
LDITSFIKQISHRHKLKEGRRELGNARKKEGKKGGREGGREGKSERKRHADVWSSSNDACPVSTGPSVQTSIPQKKKKKRKETCNYKYLECSRYLIKNNNS